MKLIRSTLFRSGTTTDGKPVAFYDVEEVAGAHSQIEIAKAVAKATGDTKFRLVWSDGGNGITARSNVFTIKSARFKDVEPHSYYLWMDDLEHRAHKCNCGQMAVLTYGHSLFTCVWCNAEFYINHCWSCGSGIDSRVRPRCGCGYYKCTCGACSSGCSINRMRR